MGFFKNLKMAIIKFEKYKDFAQENVTNTIKYLLKLLLIFVICITFATTIPIVNGIYNGIQYMKNEIPNFSITESKLSIETEEPISIVNDDISLMITINTNLNSDEANSLLKQNNEYDNEAVMTADKVFIRVNNASGIMTYDYNSIMQILDINQLSKQDIIDYFDNSGYVPLIITISLMMFAYLLLTYLFFTILDLIMFSILALLTAKIYKVGLEYKHCFNIAVYALTLPIILNIIYVIVNTITKFNIQYFQIMYYAIAYIYIITAILMIKTDFNKTASDMMKIECEIKKEKEEKKIEEPKEDKDKEKEKKEKNKKEEDNTPEPDPGNA